MSVLTTAREIIRRHGWTQGALARREDGNPCTPFDPAAECFCLVGSLMAAKGACVFTELAIEIDLISTVIGKPLVSIWNDAPERTRKEILAALDRSIAEQRRQQSTAALPRSQARADWWEPSEQFAYTSNVAGLESGRMGGFNRAAYDDAR